MPELGVHSAAVFPCAPTARLRRLPPSFPGVHVPRSHVVCPMFQMQGSCTVSLL